MGSFQNFHQLSLRCLSTEEHRLDSRTQRKVPKGEHPWFGYVMKGAVKVTLHEADGLKVLQAAIGEVFLVPPHRVCSLLNAEQESAKLLLIQFECDNPALYGTQEERFWPFRLPEVQYWAQDFLQANAKEDPALFYRVQAHLYSMAAACMTAVRQPKGKDDELIESVLRVRSHMLQQCGTKIDIEETARLSGAGTTRFYQMFKRATGFSPLKFMTITRLNESLRRLSHLQTPIKDVAYEVGYPDELYFSRLFRKQMGLTPTEYAGRTKKRIASLGPVFTGDLSVLGIIPVVDLPRKWYEDQDTEPWIQQVVQAAPDLIFTSPVSEEVYAALSEIAPVHVIDWKGRSWKNRLLQIARLLEIESVAERWLDWFEQKVDNARRQLQEQFGEEPFLVASIDQPHFHVYGLQRLKMADLFYQDLQITPPVGAESISFKKPKSLEEVEAIDCDHVFLLAPSTLSAECCDRLQGSRKHYIILSHDEPLLYTASFYQSLVEGIVDQVLLRR